MEHGRENGPVTVIAIFGPTASGKSAVAEAVAERIPAELVSADAMQVYRDLPILTNQTSHPTRLVGIWPLEHEASVGEYAELAHAAIDEILAAGRTAIVVGGTGLYLRAALADLSLPPAPEPGARERWARLYDEEGAEAAHARLAALDPAAGAVVHANDRRRVVRALELAEAGSSLAPEHDRLWAGAPRHPTLLVGLDLPKDVVERRIEERTRAMFDAGVAGRGSAGAGAADLRDGAQDDGDRRGGRASARRGDRSPRRPHAALRRLPAQVDAPARGARYGRGRPPAGRGRR